MCIKLTSSLLQNDFEILPNNCKLIANRISLIANHPVLSKLEFKFGGWAEQLYAHVFLRINCFCNVCLIQYFFK